MGHPGQRPQQLPYRSDHHHHHHHVYCRAESCNLPPCRQMSHCQGTVLAGILQGLVDFSYVELQKEFISSGLGQCFFIRAQRGEKGSHTCWHSQGVQCGETALTFPESLPRSNPAFPIICTEELWGKLFAGLTLLHLVRTGKTSYFVRLTQCHKQK